MPQGQRLGNKEARTRVKEYKGLGLKNRIRRTSKVQLRRTGINTQGNETTDAGHGNEGGLTNKYQVRHMKGRNEVMIQTEIRIITENNEFPGHLPSDNQGLLLEQQ
ncbi:hypothetical protein COCON_G00172130 [Conger conger]|uniref:Uncharacterized protein n=1 Tax=Conger conger TaxID=82655 RepID=A0A9Q1D891_CONCO|nr:hypothetical protein COCON_G00172130 [Conger conger]